MQTFASIELNNIIVTEENILIKVPARLKTSRKNSNQPLLVLPFYNEETNLCVASTLIKYIEITKTIRKDTEKLFISTQKSYNAASVETLSRWTKDTLHSSGINTEVFSAHSTRHASTSAAKRLGVDLELIRKTAGWTDNSATFAKFYNREIVSNTQEYALRIFQNK